MKLPYVGLTVVLLASTLGGMLFRRLIGPAYHLRPVDASFPAPADRAVRAPEQPSRDDPGMSESEPASTPASERVVPEVVGNAPTSAWEPPAGVNAFDTGHRAEMRKIFSEFRAEHLFDRSYDHVLTRPIGMTHRGFVAAVGSAPLESLPSEPWREALQRVSERNAPIKLLRAVPAYQVLAFRVDDEMEVFGGTEIGGPGWSPYFVLSGKLGRLGVTDGRVNEFVEKWEARRVRLRRELYSVLRSEVDGPPDLGDRDLVGLLVAEGGRITTVSRGSDPELERLLLDLSALGREVEARLSRFKR